MEAILENTRKPALIGTGSGSGGDDHTYQDKYALVEFVANSGIASYSNSLKFIGIDNDVMEKAMNWVHNLNQTVSLEFKGNMYSEFVKEEEGGDDKVITSEKVTTEEESKTKKKTTTETVKVKQPKWNYHYKMYLEITLSIKTGEEQISLMEISESIPYVQTSYHKMNGSLYNRHRENLKRDLNLTWLLREVSSNNESQFTIDRYHESCKTPSRNDDVETLLDFNTNIFHFARDVRAYLTNVHVVHQRYDNNAKTKFNSPPQINTDDIFIPVVPVLENSTVLSTDDLDRLLKEQVKTLDSTTSAAVDKYKDSTFTTSKSVVLYLITDHIISVSEQLVASIGYVEKMLETQLIEAIGKRIDSNDFDKFMKHHNQKFFNGDYAPVPFSRAVQIPGRYPDGVISIESIGESFDIKMDSNSEPIETLVRKIPGTSSSSSMVIPIDAATKVELQGDQYLHGWIQHVWENNRGKNHNLVARAHQFSSYLLVIGVLGGGGTFIPKEALILKNKDEVIIPLLSEILPSAKEFKNAIASLSPEQQEFAKAFRAMQLESSVFGICVIPLKPQMESLLNLPNGALTKEIQLMQDLMSLFVEYQIPSDLLSFDGPEDTSGIDRVDAVKGHVAAVIDVIEGEKKKQLSEAKDRAKMAYNEQRAEEYYPAGKKERHFRHEYASDDVLLADADFDFDEEIMADEEIMYMGAAAATAAAMVESMPEPSLMPSTIKSASTRPRGTKDRFESMQRNPNEKKRDIGSNSKPPQGHTTSSSNTGPSTTHDFTFIPKLLDAKLNEQNDNDDSGSGGNTGEGALKSTIIQTSPQNWERLRKESLLLPPRRSNLTSDQMKSEKNEAMDLLKAISRSGSLPIAQSDLHVIVSVSHCFHNNLLSTVVQDNVNPIEQVEKSLLMIGSVIYSVEPQSLLSLEEVDKREMMKGRTEIKNDAAVVG